MSLDYLDFEKPIAELEEKIVELQRASSSSNLDLEQEISLLRQRNHESTKAIFSKLGSWQITQLARHPRRPYTQDYIQRIVTDFQELHGDRMFADDPAIITGLGTIKGRNVAIIGHQKGRDTRERTRRNFGMPRPEGYRKAQRVMRLAARFQLPVVTLIDTPGAYPGVDAEERGQSEAIASSLEVMTTIKTPIVSVVIGEGGSGGALAIGVCDKLMMLEYSTYSVISPEGCASILWKSAAKATDAAEAMGVTTKQLSRLGLVDEVIKEPLGGAHRDYDGVSEAIENAITRSLDELCDVSHEVLMDRRYQRLTGFGKFELKN
ncbi:MAG: acetyl-CoA carboxylase carboxyltransferase subunit alpha [Gammaproteobacteria bacterium]|nr:acetyl-CoA carboxylase carboxyltransferase subunit alpha [Gammaproteobacteria bacterium]